MANSNQLILWVVILAAIFLVFWWSPSEGLDSLPGSMRPCPKHVWCSCIDEAGQARGSVKVATEYHAPFRCKVKHQGRACEYCKKAWGSDTDYMFGDCYFNWAGTRLEKAHCPGYQRRESCGECIDKCHHNQKCVDKCLKTCID